MIRFDDYAPYPVDDAGKAPHGREDWLVLEAVTRTRDAGLRAVSNFERALDILDADNDPNVEVVQMGHWGHGNIRVITVAPGTKAAEEAEAIEGALADYPVLDDADLSAREQEYYEENWAMNWSDDFARALIDKFEIDEEDEAWDLVKFDADPQTLRELYESVIEDGCKHENGTPWVDEAAREVTRERFDDLVERVKRETCPTP